MISLHFSDLLELAVSERETTQNWDVLNFHSSDCSDSRPEYYWLRPLWTGPMGVSRVAVVPVIYPILDRQAAITIDPRGIIDYMVIHSICP